MAWEDKRASTTHREVHVSRPGSLQPHVARGRVVEGCRDSSADNERAGRAERGVVAAPGEESVLEGSL